MIIVGQKALLAQTCPTTYTLIQQTSLNNTIEANAVLPSFGSDVYMKLYDKDGNLLDTSIDSIRVPSCRDDVYQLEAVSTNGSICSFPIDIDPSYSGTWLYPQSGLSTQEIEISNADFTSGIGLASSKSIELVSDVCIQAGSNSTLAIYSGSSLCTSRILCPAGVNFIIDNATASDGDVICLDINASGLNNILAMQFSLVFNPNYLSFVSCMPGALQSYNCSNITLNQINEGIIKSLWFDSSLATQPFLDNWPLMTLCFEVMTVAQVNTIVEADMTLPPEFVIGDPNDPSVTIVIDELCPIGGIIQLN